MRKIIFSILLIVTPFICQAKYSNDYKQCVNSSNGSTFKILDCTNKERDKNRNTIKSDLNEDSDNKSMIKIISLLKSSIKDNEYLLDKKCSVFNLIYPEGQASEILEQQCYLDGTIEIRIYIENVIDTAKFEFDI